MNEFPLPPHLRLHELRRDAKALFESALDGDLPCLDRFDEISKEPSLTAAQLLVARRYGFSSWAKLKQQVERNAADPRTEIVRQLHARCHRRPDDELGVVVPYEQVVAVSPETTVAVSSVRVHRDSCLIDLEWVTCREVDFDTPQLELAFSDGRTTSQHPDWVAAAMAQPGVEIPALGECSSYGGGPHGGQRLALWPLPPPGDLRITLSWPKAGIPDGTSAVLDAMPIRAAVRRVRPFTFGSPDDDAAPESTDRPRDPPETTESRRRRMGLFQNPPEDYLYTVVPVGKLVARSSRLVVAIPAIRVHRTGCLLEVEWKAHLPGESRRSPYWMAITDLFRRFGPSIGGRSLSARYGVEFADGRAVEYVGGEPHWPGGEPAEDPPSPELMASGGSSRQTELMLAPLPPPGEVRFTFAYPEFGVPETTTILDGTAINEAAARCTARRRRCR